MTSYTFDQLLDFTRTTSGTFVGSNGLIQTTPASVNLLTFTQEFDNAAWIKSNSTVTANATTAPDGTATADKLVENTANAQHFVLQLPSANASTVYTFTVYLKASERTRAALVDSAGSSATGVFDLSSGAVVSTSNCTASVSNSGNGWYRCSITFTSAVGQTGVNARVFLVNTGTNTTYTGDGVSGVFLWGAEVEAAAAATTYTRNNGGRFPARFDYDPVTLAPKGILIEEQRTNLLTYSEQFDNAAWNKNNATVTANAAVAPDGTSTADKLVEDATNNIHRVSQVPTLTAVSHTATIYAKPAGRNWLYMANASLSQAAYFNVSTGVVGTIVGATTATITPVGNGWYRCSITSTPSAGAQNYSFYTASADGSFSYAGDGTSGLFIWGAQLEAGAFATSYIPTVASQVTRAADVCTITAPMFAPWYNQSEGTLLVEAAVPTDVDSATGNYYLAASDGTIANQILLAEVNGTTGQIQTSSVLEFNNKVGVEPTGIVKAALAYKTNDVILCVGGTLGTLDTSVALPTVNRLSIGIRGDNNASTPLNGHIRSIQYYPVRLADFQLQALTA